MHGNDGKKLITLFQPPIVIEKTVNHRDSQTQS